MPLDVLPGKLLVLSRDQWVSKFKRDSLVRYNQNAPAGAPPLDTRPGTEVDYDANVFSDGAVALTSNAVIISNGVSRATATGQALDDWAKRLGTVRLSPVGSAGAVALQAGTNGATLYAGDLLQYTPTSVFYQVTATGLYANGQQVPVSATSTGPLTNLAAGSALTWQVNRPGVSSSNATVIQQADGSGLSGGAGLETDDQLRIRLDYIAANPPASGNDAQVQSIIFVTPGLSVQQPFSFPAIKGPGTTGVTFTLRPSQPGANRIPTTTQLSQMLAYLVGQMPADQGYFALQLVASPVTVVLKVLWAQGAPSWADSTQWPPYFASPNLVVASTNAGGQLTPTAFRLSSASLSAPTAPQVGQSVGFIDLTNGVFRRKKILTVTTISATQYDIVVDTTNGISDTSYTPGSGQACCPWSDSLGSLIPALIAYFDTLGPGEQVATFFDPGLRQRRNPLNPQLWPSTITNRLLGGGVTPTPPLGSQQNQPPVPTLFSTTTQQDVQLIEPAVPYATPVGTLGVSSNLSTFGGLAVFPE
jgi:hypothetical protein